MAHWPAGTEARVGESGYHYERHRPEQTMHDYGRGAMLDVMVVAVLIVTVKLGAIASVQVHFGLYVFALAVSSSVTAYSYLPAGIDLVSNLDNSINSLLLVTVAFLSGALRVRLCTANAGADRHCCQSSSVLLAQS